MITEDYVSFEVAKLLKEKGFMEGAIVKFFASGYDSKGNILDIRDTELKDYPRPTIQMAMKWLREVHNIHIELNPICYGDTEEDIKWHYGWAVKTTIFTDRWKRHNAEHISYEQAAEAAIKYCIENLI